MGNVGHDVLATAWITTTGMAYLARTMPLLTTELVLQGRKILRVQA